MKNQSYTIYKIVLTVAIIGVIGWGDVQYRNMGQTQSQFATYLQGNELIEKDGSLLPENYEFNTDRNRFELKNSVEIGNPDQIQKAEALFSQHNQTTIPDIDGDKNLTTGELYITRIAESSKDNTPTMFVHAYYVLWSTLITINILGFLFIVHLWVSPLCKNKK